MQYTLTAIGVSRTINGTLEDAIRLAIEIDREYQRAYGVTITDADGLTVATVDGDEVTE